MPNYKDGKIYAIKSHLTDQIYIGSTTQPLNKRIYEYKKKYDDYVNSKHKYDVSFEIMKYPDAYVELIENIECENRKQLIKRQDELINSMKPVNKLPELPKTKVIRVREPKQSKAVKNSKMNEIVKKHYRDMRENDPIKYEVYLLNKTVKNIIKMNCETREKYFISLLDRNPDRYERVRSFYSQHLTTQ